MDTSIRLNNNTTSQLHSLLKPEVMNTRVRSGCGRFCVHVCREYYCLTRLDNLARLTMAAAILCTCATNSSGAGLPCNSQLQEMRHTHSIGE